MFGYQFDNENKLWWLISISDLMEFEVTIDSNHYTCLWETNMGKNTLSVHGIFLGDKVPYTE